MPRFFLVEAFGERELLVVKQFDVGSAGELAEPSGDTDATAEGIALSTIARTVADNYQTCHENAEQLRALQIWASEMVPANH